MSGFSHFSYFLAGEVLTVCPQDMSQAGKVFFAQPEAVQTLAFSHSTPQQVSLLQAGQALGSLELMDCICPDQSSRKATL